MKKKIAKKKSAKKVSKVKAKPVKKTAKKAVAVKPKAAKKVTPKVSAKKTLDLVKGKFFIQAGDDYFTTEDHWVSFTVADIIAPMLFKSKADAVKYSKTFNKDSDEVTFEFPKASTLFATHYRLDGSKIVTSIVFKDEETSLKQCLANNKAEYVDSLKVAQLALKEHQQNAKAVEVKLQKDITFHQKSLDKFNASMVKYA